MSLALAVRLMLLGIVGTTGVGVDDEDRSRSSSRPRTLWRLFAKVAVLAEQVQRRIQLGCLLEVTARGLPRVAFGEAGHAHTFEPRQNALSVRELRIGADQRKGRLCMVK